MTRFALQRLLQAVIALLGVSIVVFALVRITGDPTGLLVSVDARPEDIERYRTSLGLDQPWYQQYWQFVTHALRGDFGNSFRHRESAIGLVLERIPNTLLLTAFAMVLAYTLPIVGGMLAAVRPNGAVDAIVRGISIVAQAAPTFWLGLVLMMLFSVRLGWLPPTGSASFRGLILPAISLSAFFMATNVRLLRSSMIEVLSRDYIRTARSKGLAEVAIILGHAFKNAAIPLLTMAGIQFASMLGGAVVTESVFAYPGMGLLAIQAIQSRDYPVIQAFVLVTAITIVVVNFLVDLAYLWLDPRIGMER